MKQILGSEARRPEEIGPGLYAVDVPTFNLPRVGAFDVEPSEPLVFADGRLIPMVAGPEQPWDELPKDGYIVGDPYQPYFDWRGEVRGGWLVRPGGIYQSGLPVQKGARFRRLNDELDLVPGTCIYKDGRAIFRARLRPREVRVAVATEPLVQLREGEKLSSVMVGQTRGPAVLAAPGAVIEDVRFQGVGTHAVCGEMSRARVVRSRFEDVGASGLFSSPGSHGVLVHQCLFQRLNRLVMTCVAPVFVRGDDWTITDCDFRDLPSQAIEFKETKGTLVAGCDFRRVCTWSCDCGAIYAWQGFWQTGVRLIGLRFFSVKSRRFGYDNVCVYPDDGTSGWFAWDIYAEDCDRVVGIGGGACEAFNVRGNRVLDPLVYRDLREVPGLPDWVRTARLA